MSWNFRSHPAVKKDPRRLSAERRNFILDAVLPEIISDPYRGEELHGPLRGFRKYRSGEDRIAYLINTARKEVVVLHIGPRGGFYERLRRRLKK